MVLMNSRRPINRLPPFTHRQRPVSLVRGQAEAQQALHESDNSPFQMTTSTSPNATRQISTASMESTAQVSVRAGTRPHTKQS